jgi:ElaB/YqjD/DUF883 family membrane-anchored ribosome-binding protein
MESNTNENLGGQPSGGSTSGSFGAGSGTTSNTGTAGGSSGFSRDSGLDTGGLADRAKNASGAAGEKLADVGATVRDKAGNLKNTLADALESGAERLRERGGGASGGQFAGASATGGTSSMVGDESNRLAQTTNQLAGGLQASADWLREADLDGLKSGIERQVKEHPGRSLAVAVGLGYLLGKAFRK